MLQAYYHLLSSKDNTASAAYLTTVSHACTTTKGLVHAISADVVSPPAGDKTIIPHARAWVLIESHAYSSVTNSTPLNSTAHNTS